MSAVQVHPYLCLLKSIYSVNIVTTDLADQIAEVRVDEGLTWPSPFGLPSAIPMCILHIGQV